MDNKGVGILLLSKYKFFQWGVRQFCRVRSISPSPRQIHPLT